MGKSASEDAGDEQGVSMRTGLRGLRSSTGESPASKSTPEEESSEEEDKAGMRKDKDGAISQGDKTSSFSSKTALVKNKSKPTGLGE
jgi:hypothetical protein